MHCFLWLQVEDEVFTQWQSLYFPDPVALLRSSHPHYHRFIPCYPHQGETNREIISITGILKHLLGAKIIFTSFWCKKCHVYLTVYSQCWLKNHWGELKCCVILGVSVWPHIGFNPFIQCHSQQQRSSADKGTSFNWSPRIHLERTLFSGLTISRNERVGDFVRIQTIWFERKHIFEGKKGNYEGPPLNLTLSGV